MRVRIARAVSVLATLLLATPAGAQIPEPWEDINDAVDHAYDAAEPARDLVCDGTGKRFVCIGERPAAGCWGLTCLHHHYAACAYTDFLGHAMPWYQGAALGCVYTTEWGYVPLAGVCYTGPDESLEEPDVCVNSKAGGVDDPDAQSCFVWTPFFSVCDDPNV